MCSAPSKEMTRDANETTSDSQSGMLAEFIIPLSPSLTFFDSTDGLTPMGSPKPTEILALPDVTRSCTSSMRRWSMGLGKQRGSERFPAPIGLVR